MAAGSSLQSTSFAKLSAFAPRRAVSRALTPKAPHAQTARVGDFTPLSRCPACKR